MVREYIQAHLVAITVKHRQGKRSTVNVPWPMYYHESKAAPNARRKSTSIFDLELFQDLLNGGGKGKIWPFMYTSADKTRQRDRFDGQFGDDTSATIEFHPKAPTYTFQLLKVRGKTDEQWTDRDATVTFAKAKQPCQVCEDLAKSYEPLHQRGFAPWVYEYWHMYLADPAAKTTEWPTWLRGRPEIPSMIDRDDLLVGPSGARMTDWNAANALLQGVISYQNAKDMIKERVQPNQSSDDYMCLLTAMSDYIRDGGYEDEEEEERHDIARDIVCDIFGSALDMCEKRDMARGIVHDVVGSAMDTDPIPDPIAVIETLADQVTNAMQEIAYGNFNLFDETEDTTHDNMGIVLDWQTGGFHAHPHMYRPWPFPRYAYRPYWYSRSRREDWNSGRYARKYIDKVEHTNFWDVD
jgi:hypothetical protein